MSVDGFWTIHLGELLDAMHVWQEDRMAERRHLGELVRGATLRLFNLELKPKDRITDPVKFWPMPWDEETVDVEKEVASWTQEERDKKAREFLERIGDQ